MLKYYKYELLHNLEAVDAKSVGMQFFFDSICITVENYDYRMFCEG